MSELASNRLLDHGVGFGIDGAGRLIQHENPAVLHQGATQSHELPFSAATCESAELTQSHESVPEITHEKLLPSSTICASKWNLLKRSGCSPCG